MSIRHPVSDCTDFLYVGLSQAILQTLENAECIGRKKKEKAELRKKDLKAIYSYSVYSECL